MTSKFAKVYLASAVLAGGLTVAYVDDANAGIKGDAAKVLGGVFVGALDVLLDRDESDITTVNLTSKVQANSITLEKSVGSVGSIDVQGVKADTLTVDTNVDVKGDIEADLGWLELGSAKVKGGEYGTLDIEIDVEVDGSVECRTARCDIGNVRVK